MKKITLFNHFNLFGNQSLALTTNENGFKMDFSESLSQQASEIPINRSNKKRKGINFLFLFILFLFTNLLFAQAPACNLFGPLKVSLANLQDPNVSRRDKLITFDTEIVNAVQGTTYTWSFRSNNTDATFETSNGGNTIKVFPGTKGGTFNVSLRVSNPGPGNSRRVCTCSQSVTVN
jgi:hypothetical protein